MSELLRRSYSIAVNLCALVLSVCVCSSDLVAQDSILIPEIVREGKANAIPIRVAANDQALQTLVTHAFNSHGAFDVVSEGSPVYILKLDRDKDDRIAYILQKATPLAEVAKGSVATVKGGNWQVAALRICDLIIEKTTDLKGFLAGRIAFVGRQNGYREIFISDLFFQKVDQLTTDKSYSLGPSWSPDGSWIIYTGYFRTGFPDIFLINPSTGQRRMFANYKGSNTGAVFSPDGKEVSMVLSSSKSTEIYISDNVGRYPKRLTNNKSAEISPAWSPDGQRLLVVSDQMGSPQIFTIDRNTQAMQRVNITISTYCVEPSWNPVRQDWIALTVGVGKTFQIAMHNLKTGETQLLTDHKGDGIEPVWMRDGRHLIYSLREGSTKRLHLLDTQTGHTTALHSARFGEASEADFVYPF